jgi:biuret amidohydrolase
MNLEQILEKMAFHYDPIKLVPQETALVLIDMQKLALSDYHVHNAVTYHGIPEAEAREAFEDFDRRFNKAIENAAAILNACRAKGIRPIHIKIESLSGDAADTGLLHKGVGFLVPPGTEWGQFIPAVKPLPGEIVMTKTCSSAFTGTMLNQVLRNLGIKEVIIVGFYTDQCVTTAARESADLGYITMLVEDATMADTLEGHLAEIKAIKNVYVRGGTTEELLKRLNNL